MATRKPALRLSRSLARRGILIPHKSKLRKRRRLALPVLHRKQGQQREISRSKPSSRRVLLLRAIRGVWSEAAWRGDRSTVEVHLRQLRACIVTSIGIFKQLDGVEEKVGHS